jgi:hypothetical protein
MILSIILIFVMALSMGIFLIHSNLSIIAKSIYIASALVLSMGVYFVETQYMGYPIEEPLPETFYLVASLPVEPTTTDKGAIYVWLTVGEETQPLYYKIPYSKETHKQMQEAKRGTKFAKASKDGASGHGSGSVSESSSGLVIVVPKKPTKD